MSFATDAKFTYGKSFQHKCLFHAHCSHGKSLQQVPVHKRQVNSNLKVYVDPRVNALASIINNFFQYIKNKALFFLFNFLTNYTKIMQNENLNIKTLCLCKEAIQVYVTQWGLGGVRFPGKKHHEDVRFNVIKRDEAVVGWQVSRKKRYVTLEVVLKFHSLLHRGTLQRALRSSLRGHALPPYSGCRVTLRRLYLYDLPHVAEQSDHSDHCDVLQLTDRCLGRSL